MSDKPTVLVVEDETLLRITVREELEDLGLAVILAENGEEAAAVIDRATGLDLVFADIRMPGPIDGWQVARLARRRFPAVPVVYTTGYAPKPEADVPDGQMLRKPYRMAELEEALARLGLAPSRG